MVFCACYVCASPNAATGTATGATNRGGAAMKVVDVLKLPAVFEPGIAYRFQGQIYVAPNVEWHAAPYPDKQNGKVLQGKKTP